MFILNFQVWGFGILLRKWQYTIKGISVHFVRDEKMDFEAIQLNEENSVKPRTGTGYWIIKRFFDVVLSLIALIILSPVLLIIAFIIYLEDKGPVVFIQERNGLNGKVFRMYKFRSMCINAPEMHEQLLEKNELDGPAFKLKNDPRVTKIGRFIRRTSIDELPQLINILKGDMSIIGPRPLPTYETAQCTKYQKQRMLVKPGLTCYWQCCGRNNIPFNEWMELDLKYIKEAGIWTDIKIIYKTFLCVINGEGAY